MANEVDNEDLDDEELLCVMINKIKHKKKSRSKINTLTAVHGLSHATAYIGHLLQLQVSSTHTAEPLQKSSACIQCITGVTHDTLISS